MGARTTTSGSRDASNQPLTSTTHEPTRRHAHPRSGSTTRRATPPASPYSLATIAVHPPHRGGGGSAPPVVQARPRRGHRRRGSRRRGPRAGRSNEAQQWLSDYRSVGLDELGVDDTKTAFGKQFGSKSDYVDMALTGPITGLYNRNAELATGLQKQDLKALVPWSHHRKNQMRGANVAEGSTDIAWNTATLATDALSLGAASTGTAAIGAGYKSGFSLAKSRIRRESGQRAATRAGHVAVGEFGQGVIPFAGSAWGIASGAKQLGTSMNLDAIAPERTGDPRVIGMIDRRLEQVRAHLGYDPTAVDVQHERSAIRLDGGRAQPGRPQRRRRVDTATETQLLEAHDWLTRQREKSEFRFRSQRAKEFIEEHGRAYVHAGQLDTRRNRRQAGVQALEQQAKAGRISPEHAELLAFYKNRTKHQYY